MCLICTDFEKGKLSIPEAYSNLREMWKDGDEHCVEVWVTLINAERELYDDALSRINGA